MNKELREAVARAIYDVLDGPVNNADFGRQQRQWELSLALADAAISIIRPMVLEEAAKVATAPSAMIDNEDSYARGYVKAAKHIAAAIRALAKEGE